MSLRSSSSEYPTASLAAIFAIGKPVALDARAEERDTRGFISITIMLPVRGSTENWMFDPPVSTPISRMTANEASRIDWYSLSVRVIAGATVIESPVWTPMGSKFSIENFDPMGVHTGDSITVAPAMTLTDKEYQSMRDASFAVIREIGVETGGSNIQFSVDRS